MSKATIILAAGNGTRMKSNISKTLHKIAGKSLISYIIKAAVQSYTDEIIIVTGPEDIALIEEVRSISTNVKFAYQNEKLGTGHAAKIGLELVSNTVDKIQILYGDTPLIKSETLIRLSHSLQKADLSILGFYTENPTNYGRLIAKEQSLLKIVEELEASDEEKKIKLCNSGILSCKANIFKNLLNMINNNNSKQEYYLTDIIGFANKLSHQCNFIETEEMEVLGINSKDQLALVEQIKQNQLRRQLLDQGVTLIAPETIFLTDDIKIGKDTIIHPNVVFGDKVEIGNNVEILSFSHIEHSKIEDNSKIGPFARLRSDNIIGPNCKIGNFVEIKNSSLEENVKASHLAYLGDSNIGKKVNIGAGTITCNYDGKKKSTTSIGDNSFIGSNTSLVAPLTIGKNTLVGAGSTITKNVPDNSWAIARAKQAIIENKNVDN